MENRKSEPQHNASADTMTPRDEAADISEKNSQKKKPNLELQDGQKEVEARTRTGRRKTTIAYS